MKYKNNFHIDIFFIDNILLCISDIDECAESPWLCKMAGTCQNLPGSYQCECQRGFEPDPTGTTCVDMNECDEDDMCDYGCVNLVGAYQCECPMGFVQHFYWNQCIGLEYLYTVYLN